MTSGCRALRVGPTSWQPTPLISVYCEVVKVHWVDTALTVISRIIFVRNQTRPRRKHGKLIPSSDFSGPGPAASRPLPWQWITKTTWRVMRQLIEVCVVGQVPRRDGQQSQTVVTASSWLVPHEPTPRNDTNMHSPTMEEFRPRVLTGP